VAEAERVVDQSIELTIFRQATVPALERLSLGACVDGDRYRCRHAGGSEIGQSNHRAFREKLTPNSSSSGIGQRALHERASNSGDLYAIAVKPTSSAVSCSDKRGGDLAFRAV
jgi:hypothetical protein